MRDNGSNGSSATATQLGKHLDLSRQRVQQLVDEHVIARLPNGGFDQDDSRVRYLRWLREPERRSVRTQADAEHAAAKTEMLQLGWPRNAVSLVQQSDVDDADS